MENPILTAANAFRKVTNLFGSAANRGYRAIKGLPLGTVGDSPTGELGVKVIVLSGGGGGGGGGGDASAANQTTEITRLASIITLLTPSPLTRTNSTISADTTIAAGKSAVALLCSSDFLGTIDGKAYDGTQDLGFFLDPVALKTQPAIEITRTQGSLDAIYY